MNGAEAFYLVRDKRSREYYDSPSIFNKPIVISVGGDVADSCAGQVMVLTAVNLLARFHRKLVFDLPESTISPSSCRPIPKGIAGSSLRDYVHQLALTINPFIGLEFRAAMSGEQAIGLGRPQSAATVFVSYDSNIVVLDNEAHEPQGTEQFSLGPLLGACATSWAAFLLATGRRPSPCRVSAWNLGLDDAAERGPNEIPPLDVGRVLLVGAGGVGSCLAYLLGNAGVSGKWTVVDRDLAELHNTNRSLGIFPSDTDWDTGNKRPKAELAARCFGGENENCWFDELPTESLDQDLILPLANSRGVRSSVGQRGEPLILHASTSKQYEAQLHRHIPDRDDCISCRMPPESQQIDLACSTVQVGKKGDSTDAALPFLSATAATMLLSSLYRLAEGGIIEERNNWWSFGFSSCRIAQNAGKWKCSASRCLGGMSNEARRKIHAHSRWRRVDPAIAGETS